MTTDPGARFRAGAPKGSAASRRFPRALLVFAAFQATSLAVLVFGWRVSLLEGSSTSFLDFLARWDGQWYLRVIEEGYPRELPRVAGTVQQNAWAFYPAFPMTVSALSGLLGTDPLPTGLALNLVLTGSAAVLLAHLARRTLGVRSMHDSLVLWAMMPAAPVLFMFYAEPLFIVLTLLVLLALTRDHYWWALGLLPLVGLTRPAAAAVGLTVVLVVARRWWADRGNGRLSLTLAAATVTGIVAALLWPALAAAATGDLNAYALTYQAWAPGPSVGMAWLPLHTTPYPYLAIVAVVLAGAVTYARRRCFRPPVPVLFAVAYLTFLVVASTPTSVTARYLLPLVTIPLALAAAQLSGTQLALLIALGLIGKFWWVMDLVVGTTGSPPP